MSYESSNSVNNQKRYAHVLGTGLYAPEKVVPNSFFNELYKKDIDTFLRTQRNIFERRWMSPKQATSDLILPAARQALSKSGLKPSDLDLIIVATDTPDYLSPSTATVVQFKLGAEKAGTFDLNSACAGFVTAMDVGAKYIQADPHYQNVLVVGAYAMSKWLNLEDYKIATLFADGAGAAVLQSRHEPGGVLSSRLYTDGQYHDYMGIYAGGSARPFSQEVLDQKAHLLNFAKKIPLETNPTLWPKLTQQMLEETGKTLSDVKCFLMTQINIQLINETLEKMGIDKNLSHNIMDRYGYTGSASIGMAMADADHQGKLKKNDLLCLLSSGGGVSMGTMLIEWTK
jgi:3-oxoacyl-[acyl-carrier-protein] synthase-3